MSLQEKPSKLTDKLNLTPNKDTYAELSTQNQTYQESTENEKLIKPIPINIKLIKRSKSEITTKPDSTLTIKQIVQELKMEINEKESEDKIETLKEEEEENEEAIKTFSRDQVFVKIDS